MAAFGLLGCSTDAPAPPTAPPPPAASSGEVPAQLPQPSALLDVLTRISDPAVPGSDKLGLIEGGTAGDATALDDFTAALSDSQLTPLEFSVTHIASSDREPGAVVADVAITPAEPGPEAEPFSFPMEFRTVGGTWQLSRYTADLLLEYGR